MQPVNVKVYGNCASVGSEALEAVATVCRSWNCAAEITLEGALLRLSYEGVYFPADDVIEALRPFIGTASTGKMDVMDLEAWTLTRYAWVDGVITKRSRDLNAVMDYSGH